MSERDEGGWFLPRAALNEPQIATLERFLAHAKRAHEIDCKIRKDAVETWYELDFIKHLAASPHRLTKGQVKVEDDRLMYDEQAPLSKQDMTAAYAATARGIGLHPYGDRLVLSQSSWRRRFALLMQRVSDAWAVLRGRAFIDQQ